jgi:hypothetical protein
LATCQIYSQHSHKMRWWILNKPTDNRMVRRSASWFYEQKPVWRCFTT